MPKIVQIPSSKSISNRLLILQKVSVNYFFIEQLSQADDTLLLQALLQQIEEGSSQQLQVDNCGTAYRFLLPYLANKEGVWTIDGSDRLRQRPIKDLVDVLRLFGVKIDYLRQEGYAPLRIMGGKLLLKSVKVNASLSSQFLSALLLQLPPAKEQIIFNFDPQIMSLSYVDMTIKLMQQIGYKIQRDGGKIVYSPSIPNPINPIKVEADWSAAAFWYQYVALSGEDVLIENLQKSDLQGDAVILNIMETMGVCTKFCSEGALLTKTNQLLPDKIEIDCANCLDLVPLLTTLCVGLKKRATLKRVVNLLYKETNRVAALQKELSYWATINLINNDLIIIPNQEPFPYQHCFCSHKDHRIVLSLAMLKPLIPHIEFDEKNCVSKSYPNFNFFK